MPLKSLDFKDPSLFELALTHSSCSKDNPGELSNERLEFYGDAVLKLIFSKYLYNRFPEADEGILTRYRARLISDALLAEIAHDIGVDGKIKIGSSLAGKPKLPASVIGDSLEAIIGAIYIDQGYESSEAFVLQAWESHIEDAIRDAIEKDYKSLLQEKIQRDNDRPPEYKTLSSSGPDHNKEFVVGVYSGDKLLGQASGKSKKEAGQNAAKAALDLLQ